MSKQTTPNLIGGREHEMRLFGWQHTLCPLLPLVIRICNNVSHTIFRRYDAKQWLHVWSQIRPSCGREHNKATIGQSNMYPYFGS